MATLVVLGLAAAWLLWQAGAPKKPYVFFGTSYSSQKAMPDFALTDGENKRVRLGDFRGKIVLLEFGFTNCPNICPTSLGSLAAINQALKPEEREKVRVLFITVDPQRDTPAVLREYMPFFDKSFTGLTGSAEEVDRVAKTYGVFYRRLPLEGKPDDYTMDHSALLYLIDQEGRLRVSYAFEKVGRTGEIVSDIRHLLQTP